MKYKIIILGTDNNAYAFARSVHMYNGDTSLLLGTKRLTYTDRSKILNVRVYENFDDTGFVAGIKKFLEETAEELKDYKKILIPCSDGYVKLVAENREFLEKHFLFNVVDKKLQEKLENKIDFYKICEEYNLAYPKTYIVNSVEEFKKLNLTYPIAIKPNDSVLYAKIHFPDKKKAYKSLDFNESQKIISDMIEAGYNKEIIIQDFIPGGPEKMGVLNAYVNKNGHVTMLAFARCVLDEVLPTQIGNYNALISENNDELYKSVQEFLEKINYRGFANFDFKYDERTNSYKVFEINLRQGRSSFYVTGAGLNMAEILIKDLIYDEDAKLKKLSENHLWLFVSKSVLKKYASPENKELALKLIKEKKYSYATHYKKDVTLKRLYHHIRRLLSTIKYYPKYVNKR